MSSISVVVRDKQPRPKPGLDPQDSDCSDSSDSMSSSESMGIASLAIVARWRGKMKGPVVT